LLIDIRRAAALIVAAMTWSTVSMADPPEAAAHKYPGAPRGREPIAYKRPSFEQPKSQYQPLPRVDTLLTGATLLDGVGGRADDVDVLMRNGVIVAVGRHLRQEGVSVNRCARPLGDTRHRRYSHALWHVLASADGCGIHRVRCAREQRSQRGRYLD